MSFWKVFGAAVLVSSALSAQQATDDPVLKIQAQRAQSANDGDLPPVPRGILEPPPLPPPEMHVKDTRGYRVARVVRKSRARALRGVKTHATGSRVPKKILKKKH